MNAGQGLTGAMVKALAMAMHGSDTLVDFSVGGQLRLVDHDTLLGGCVFVWFLFGGVNNLQ